MGRWSRRARGSNPSTREDSETVKGASTFRTVSPFAGRHSKGVSGRFASDGGISPFPPPSRIGDAGAEEALEEGNHRLRSMVLRSSLLTHARHKPPRGGSWSSGLEDVLRDGFGLPTMGSVARAVSPGDRGGAATRRGLRPEARRGSIALAGVLACRPCSEIGSGAPPGNGRVVVAEVVRRRLGPEKRPSTLPPGRRTAGVAGDLAAAHVQKTRGAAK